MGAWSFPHPCISASSVLSPIQYRAEDVLTLVMPHTAKWHKPIYFNTHDKNAVNTRSRTYIYNIQYLEHV